MMSRRVLVLGGTGAMGVYLVPELLKAGYVVAVTSRSPHASTNPSLRHLQGDGKDLTFVQTAIKDFAPDAIFDFMSYLTPEFSKRRDFLLASTSHYLFLSSYRVFANAFPEPLTERSPRLLDVCPDKDYLATDEYALAKARQEDLLRDSGRANWTIIRPGITYSQRRFQFGTLEADTVCFRALQGLPVVMAREILSKQTTMTWAGDVAKLMSLLVFKDSALTEDFNAVTSEHQTWATVASYYEAFLGLAYQETDLETYTKIVGDPYQIQYDRMYDRILDNTKILQTTGVRQSELRLLRDGLKEELASFRRAPSYPRLTMQVNARTDRYLGTRISLRDLCMQLKAEYWLDMFLPGLSRSRIYKELLSFYSLAHRFSAKCHARFSGASF